MTIPCIRCRALGKDIAPFLIQIEKHRVLLSVIYESATQCRTCAILLVTIKATIDVDLGSPGRVETMLKEYSLLYGPLRVNIILGSVTFRLQLYIPRGEDQNPPAPKKEKKKSIVCMRLMTYMEPPVSLELD